VAVSQVGAQQRRDVAGALKHHHLRQEQGEKERGSGRHQMQQGCTQHILQASMITTATGALAAAAYGAGFQARGCIRH
jgi:hypothetical protein